MKILENNVYFLPIIIAGLSVTVPLCILSTALDSFYYGEFSVPQINFITVNIVENLSIFFGIDPWFFYIE